MCARFVLSLGINYAMLIYACYVVEDRVPEAARNASSELMNKFNFI